MPRSVTELLTCWGGLFRKNANAATWKVISLCLMEYLEGEECMHIGMKCTLSCAVEVVVLMVLCNYRIIKKEKRLLNCNNECIYLMPPVMNISAILNW
jgi:hypothetical protein